MESPRARQLREERERKKEEHAEQARLFAQWLKSEMGERRLKSTDLARRMKVQASVVTRWLSGKHVPDMDSIHKLALGLGVSVDTVVEAAGKPPLVRRRPGIGSKTRTLIGYVESIDWDRKPGQYDVVEGILRNLVEDEIVDP